MSSVREFFELLFEPGETTCLSKDPYSINLRSARNGTYWNFFSINPMTGSRADANVTVYRNILIEMDKLPLDVQLKLFESMPISTLVYSGGKSYHGIISLQEPCQSRQEYDTLVKRIYAKVLDADQSTKNPSRFSRTPGAFRDNGKYQDLIWVKQRIPRDALEAWLGPDLKTEPAFKIQQTNPTGWHRILTPFTNHFLKFGVAEGHWHDSLVKATCDMARAGFGVDEIEAKVYNVNKHLDKHDINTIRSCFKMVKGSI